MGPGAWDLARCNFRAGGTRRWDGFAHGILMVSVSRLSGLLCNSNLDSWTVAWEFVCLCCARDLQVYTYAQILSARVKGNRVQDYNQHPVRPQATSG